jgi:hypothetical protein
MLRATYAGNTPARATDRITGNGMWQCYRKGLLGNVAQLGVIQIGNGPPDQLRSPDTQPPGGYPDCFWHNHTVTDGTKQIWNMTGADVAAHMTTGRPKLAAQAAEKGHACRGCAFPRLTDGIITTEVGMPDPRRYIDDRREVLGY